MDNLNSSERRIPHHIMTIALISRAIVLAALAGGIVAARRSDIVIDLAARYVPTNNNSVVWVISAFVLLNHLYSVPFAVITSLAAYYMINRAVREKMKDLLLILLMSGGMYVSLTLCVQKIPRLFFLYYSAVSAAAVLLVRMRKQSFPIRFPSLSLPKYVFICTPFLAEVFFPFEAIYFFASPRLRTQRVFEGVVRAVGPVYTAVVSGAVACYLLTMMAISTGLATYDIKGKVRQIAAGSYYSLELDRGKNHLIAANMGDNEIEIYDVRQQATKLFGVAIPTEELEDVQINAEKKELYHFDRGRNRFLVYDLDTFNLKKESTESMAGQGSADIAFDNASNVIAVTREDDNMWILDLATLRPLKTLPVADWTELIVFSKQLNAFVLSYFSQHPFILVVSPDGQMRKRIAAKRYQGGIAISDRFNELYIALPLAGKIAVYAIPSLELKRMIPTVFGVRGIAYDDTHDLLVGASFCDGYVDTIDRSSGHILKRIFVGYALREICLNEQKREAYVSSSIGGLCSFEY